MHRFPRILWQHAQTNEQPAIGLFAKAVLMAVAIGLSACAEAPSPEEEIVSISADLATDCVPGGRLRAELIFGTGTKLEWAPAELACEGMRRPADHGARLRFSGAYSDAGDSQTLTLILGIPTLEEAQIGNEMPTSVTLIEDGGGRFFATQDTAGCWTDINEHEQIGSNSDEHYMISGKVFCVTPLAELNGSASVTVTDLDFSGRVNWEPQE